VSPMQDGPYKEPPPASGSSEQAVSQEAQPETRELELFNNCHPVSPQISRTLLASRDLKFVTG